MATPHEAPGSERRRGQGRGVQAQPSPCWPHQPLQAPPSSHKVGQGAPLSPPSPTIIQSPALSAESLQILNDKVLTEVHTIASYSFISISDDMQGTLICMSCSKTLKGFLLFRTVAYLTFFAFGFR